MNEYTGLKSNTRIVLFRYNQYGMILSDLEKEREHDHNGRIAYHRRCGPYPQNIRVHCQRDVQTRRNQIQEDWQELESEARGSARVHRQATRTRPEINKATDWWQMTINKFTAV